MLRFDAPADQLLSRYFREPPQPRAARPRFRRRDGVRRAAAQALARGGGGIGCAARAARRGAVTRLGDFGARAAGTFSRRSFCGNCATRARTSVPRRCVRILPDWLWERLVRPTRRRGGAAHRAGPAEPGAARLARQSCARGQGYCPSTPRRGRASRRQTRPIRRAGSPRRQACRSTATRCSPTAWSRCRTRAASCSRGCLRRGAAR